MKKTYAALMCLLFAGGSICAQPLDELSIDTCYARARANYPLIVQKDLLEQARDFTLSNLAKSYLPQLSINGQATYQSDVTALPISLPNMTLPESHKDQYKIYAEAVQPITDLLTVSYQRDVAQANADAEAQKLEVELYKLNERVNQLFFGILLIDAQLSQVGLLEKDLNTGLDRTRAAIANGIALRSSADLVSAELLRIRQRRIELTSARSSFVAMLAQFTGLEIKATTHLQSPVVPDSVSEISRPELRLFEQQKSVFDAQSQLITARTLPRFSLFLQSGYGRPALNMLSDEFDFYYIGGLRMQWNLSSLYTSGRERQLLKVNQSMIDAQHNTFEHNISIQQNQQLGEIDKLQQIITTDSEIIALRESIKNSYSAQLENGTATASDYIIQVNAEDRARQDMLLHQMQLLQAQYANRFLMGQ